MFTSNQRNWPSANANGILLTDPVAISFNGDVLLLAREKGVPTNKLYYNVRHNDPDVIDDNLEYSGWYELDMTLASSEPGSTPSKVGVRVLGAGLVTVPSSAQSAQATNLPFAAVSDDRYIYIFRPSPKGTLYLDRFILLQVPAPQEDNNKVRRDSSKPKPTRYRMDRIWELRYRVSGEKDTPADERDMLGYRDMLGNAFIEPSLELAETPRCLDGRFAIALLPTSEVDKSRWCYFAVIDNQIQIASWPQGDDGLFDFLPDFWSDAPPSSFSIAPKYIGDQSLTCAAGVGVRVYAEQDPIKNGSKLRRSMRLMLTVPIAASDIGINRAMAVYDFNILPSGYLPIPSSPLKCAFLDGQLVNGKFEPTTPLPALFPVTQNAVTLAYNSTIYSYLLGSVQPAATPFVLDGGDGLVHCYYGAFSADEFHHFMVAQYSSEVTRPVIPLKWVAGDQNGNLDLIAQRPGTSLNQTKVTLADAVSPDLCNMNVDYDAAVSGIGTESWVGLPRELQSLTAVLNGRASGELLSRQVQDGSMQYFDFDGIRHQVRLPITSASKPTGWLTLVSTRQDLSLAEVEVSSPTADKVTVVISLKQGTNAVTQTWSDLPIAATDLRTVLRGDAASYSYLPKSTDPWALGLSAADGTATMVFYASPSAPVEATSITIEQGTTADKVNVKLESGTFNKSWTDLPANSQELAKSLLAIPEVTTVFPVISAGDNGGRVAAQSSVQPLNLRALSLLFSTLPPSDIGPVIQSSVSASVLQGHSQASPQTMTPLANRLIALSALAAQVPNNGIAAILGNQTATANGAESNGAWVSAKPLYALALPGTTAMFVPTSAPNFDAIAPSKAFTMETWLHPNGGTAPARVFSFNGTQSGKTPDWKVAPNFFLSVFAQPALQFAVLQSAASRPSFGSIQPNEFFTPDQGFTFEIWIKPTSPISPQGLRGSLLQLLNPNSPSPCTMEISLDTNLKPVITFSDGSKNPIQTADTTLRPDVWTHIAVTGQQADPQNQLWKVSLYVNGQESSIKDQPLKIVWQRAGLNSFVIGGMGNANNPTAAAAMAEIRYWQICRTRTDIQDSLYYTLAGTEPGLVGYWPLSKGVDLENLCIFGGPHLSGTVDVSTRQPIVPDSDGTFLAVAAGVGGAPALKANAFLRATHWNHVAVSYQAGSAVHLNAVRHDLLVCKNDASLNLTDTFSIEAWIQVDASSQPLPQTFVAKWGKDATQQSYWLGLNALGQLNLQAQYEYKRGSQDKQVQLVNAVPDVVTNLRDGKPHHVAATSQVTTVYDKEKYQSNLLITVTLFVDGVVVGVPVTTITNLLAAKLQTTTVDLTLGAAVPTDAGVAANTAPEAQMYLAGMLTGVVLWSHAIDGKTVATSIQKRMSMQRDGAVAAWWFLEQAGVDAVDSIGGLVAKLSSNDLWAVYNRLSELLFYSNGRRLLSIEPASDANLLEGYPGGPTQFTLGGYQNGTALEDSLQSQFNEVRLWQQVRSQKQIADMRFTRLVGDESGLTGYWNFDDRSLNDESPFGNNGAMWKDAAAPLVTSDAPVANEGPAVLNVYGGQPTEFQQQLSGTPAVIEFSEVSRAASSPLDPPASDDQPAKLIGELSRAYYYTSATVNLTPGFFAGSLRLVYLGQVQTDATLLGFIEGAPPVPSENLTRPYYGSSTGYFSYFNASTISLSENEATTVSYNTSYGHSGTLDHTTSGGFRLKTKVDITLGPLPPIEYRSADIEFKLGAKEKGGFSDQNVTILNSTSSWSVLTSDSLSLRGNWETDDPEKFVNPQVGRRFLPDNVGYALVSSLTADVYLTYNSVTGAAVGRAVVPNPDIPPDNNILTFQIDNTYIKNGTLDGKVGLYNDPDYANANDVRGSYFKPIEAYRLKRQIAKKAADEERYFEQFDFYKRAIGSDTSLSDQEPNRLVQRSPDGIVARKGMANTYVWTAAGGLHTEQEQYTDQYTTTFTGGYSVNNQFGIVSEFSAVASGIPPMFGGFFSVDWMGGFKIDISVTKSRTKNSVFGLNVGVTGEPALLTWDQKQTKYGTKPTPGKVAAYRFLTLYLPPDDDNGKTLMDQVVDRNWLRSNDADAVTLRSARVANPAWRVLYRVTYVNRIPPDLDNTPNQTLPAPIPRLVDLENNEVLVALILDALGAQQPTPANVGSAVAAVINPPSQGGNFPPSKLGTLVPWWDDFLATTRGANRNQANYELLQTIQLNILQYVLAGFDQADVTNSSKTFSGVTEAIFNSIKETSHARHGTVYDPPTGNKGIATTETDVGKVILGFSLDTSSQAVQYWVVSKPWIIEASQIFDGIATLIKDCQQKK
jgi:hypothetical protein